MRLDIRGISKRYPSGVQALSDVTLTIPAGMYGLLGPQRRRQVDADAHPRHAAGARRRHATLGDIDVLRDRDAVRRTLGYLPQEFGVYPHVSAEELLDHFALLKGIAAPGAPRRVEALLRQVNLWDVRRRSSAATRAACAALRRRRRPPRRPKLMIVDEPTAGLDPGRARALPQPALRARRAQRRPPLHAHRRGRERAVHPLGDHRPRADPARGEPLRAGRRPARPHLAPHDRRAELPALEREHAVISTKLLAGRTVVHVHADAPRAPASSPRAGPRGRLLQRDGGAGSARTATGATRGGVVRPGAIARFELAYQLRRPQSWLFMAAPAAGAFLFTRDGALADATRDDFFINSPSNVAGATLVAASSGS
jgi:ABC-type Na+ transport system ATPase subunit NatA